MKLLSIIETRFWSYVKLGKEPNDCWIWQSAKDKDGYGQLQINNKKIKPHRLSYELFYGEIESGMEVMHNCPNGDNKACVHPLHLLLGTPAEHGLDKKNKEQMPKGSKHYKTKLTEEQVIRIKFALRIGISCSAIAVQEGVSASAIKHIKYNGTWKHVLPNS